MSHANSIRKLEGKLAGSYLYTDSEGKERVGHMPPEILDQVLRAPGVRKVTPIRIREADDTIREDFWPLDEATEKKFADSDGIVHVLSQDTLDLEAPCHYFVAKVLWERYDDITAIVLNTSLSEEQKQERMKAILKR